MKTKTLKLTAILLITAGIFTACSCIKIEIHDETCPIKEILVGGKWEIVGFYNPRISYNEIVQNPYHEYFPDGLIRRFSTVFGYEYGTYTVEVRKGNPFPWAPDVTEYWHLSIHLDAWESASTLVGMFRGKNEKVAFEYGRSPFSLFVFKRKK